MNDIWQINGVLMPLKTDKKQAHTQKNFVARKWAEYADHSLKEKTVENVVFQSVDRESVFSWNIWIHLVF